MILGVGPDHLPNDFRSLRDGKSTIWQDRGGDLPDDEAQHCFGLP